MNLQRGHARARPEGPFESGDAPRAKGIIGEEFALFLDFIDALGDEADQVLSLKRGYDETRLITTLLRNHLEGRLTTTSYLANASGMGYGTAIRAIKRDRGPRAAGASPADQDRQELFASSVRTS